MKRYQVIQASSVTLFSPDRFRGHQLPTFELKGLRELTIPLKGHQLAELPGTGWLFYDILCLFEYTLRILDPPMEGFEPV